MFCSARVCCQNIAQAAGKRGLKSELNQLIMKMQMFSSAPAASFFSWPIERNE